MDADTLDEHDRRPLAIDAIGEAAATVFKRAWLREWR